jgi:hypothetical protein
MQTYYKRPDAIVLVIIFREFYDVGSANAVNKYLLGKPEFVRLWVVTAFITRKKQQTDKWAD